jgi:hypothetical protein
LGDCFFLLECSNNEPAFERRLSAQVEVGALPVLESAPHPFGTIVGRFPIWVTQELTHPLKLAFRHLLLDTSQWWNSSVVGLCAPVLITHSGLVESVVDHPLVSRDDTNRPENYAPQPTLCRLDCSATT